jgi:hypothetical protein
MISFEVFACGIYFLNWRWTVVFEVYTILPVDKVNIVYLVVPAA